MDSILKVKEIVCTLSYSKKDIDEIIHRLSKVYGIKSISPVLKTEKNDQAMADVAVQLAQSFDKGSTFKIDVKRSDKSYPKDTYELQREIGGAVLKNVEGLTVDETNHNMKFV